MFIERLSYIDTAKFIAILCIVLGHSNTPLHDFLYSFHVQMFFICTGFVFFQKFNNIKDYIQQGLPKLIKRIYIPYILLVLIFNIQLKAENIPWLLWGSDQTVMHDKQYSFMWFLPTYFSAIVIWNILNILLRKHKKAILPIIITFLATISYLTRSNAELCVDAFGHTFFLTGYDATPALNCHYIGFPLNINVAFTAVVFIYIGTLIHHIFDYTQINYNKNKAIVGLISFFIIGFVSYEINKNYYTPIDNHINNIMLSWGAYGNYILFLITSTTISISAICMATLIDNPILAQIGKNTFGIYAFHPFVRNCLEILLFDFAWIMRTSVGGFIMFFATILLLPFIKKWFPFIIGEKEK